MNSAFRTIVYTLVCLGAAKCYEMDQFLHLSTHFHSSEVQEKDMVAKIKGDLILGGLFSLHDGHSNEECAKSTSPRNILRVEAMLYAVKEVSYDTQPVSATAWGLPLDLSLDKQNCLELVVRRFHMSIQ